MTAVVHHGPSLPRFKCVLPINAIPIGLESILPSSRPLFARNAHEIAARNSISSSTGFVDYMNLLTGMLSTECVGWKAGWPSKWFRTGQLCLFVPASCIRDIPCTLISGHYACLSQQAPFKLSIGLSDSLVKDEEATLWMCRVDFPSVEQDVLLSLVSAGRELLSCVDERKVRVSFVP